jgi:SAM-dependent methyltransferase
MNSIAQHYDDHLGPVYSWMVGDLDAALVRSDADLAALPLPDRTTGLAVDLGAGIGLHALPLARRGFSVLAVDACQALLDELKSRSGTLAIHPLHADLRHFRASLDTEADIVLCMGDTLTHLPDRASVEQLFADVAMSLREGGFFVATFRDYVSAPLQGDGRFIPVRSDAQRILTCFLEYEETAVRVHDLLHEREGTQWRLRVSSYPKRRLDPEGVVDALRSRGFAVQPATAQNGMVRVVARLSRR